MAIEIEDKFDVPVDYELPDLTGLPGVTDVVGPRTYQLVALYYDTPDLRLAARGSPCGGAEAGPTRAGTSNCPRPRASGRRSPTP